MLVLEHFTDYSRDAAGNLVKTEGQRWVERPGVVTPEVQAATDAANAQAEAVATGNETSLRQQAESTLTDLRAYRDAATTTTAQDKAAIKLLVRVAIGLIRLVLRKLDATN